MSYETTICPHCLQEVIGYFDPSNCPYLEAGLPMEGESNE